MEIKFLDFSGLIEFLNNCKAIFASILHSHKLEDITDYVVDSEILDDSTNPVENKVIQSAIVLIKNEFSDHVSNNDVHFTTDERTKLSSLENYIHPDSGVIANTYRSVTVDSRGHVLDGTNPTTLSEYGITDAETKGTVDTHNIQIDAHSDIRLSISELTTQINNFLDVDDETKDQLSEVIELIQNNQDLIAGITTSKVNVSDIIDNLTTNISNQPLSAAQGVAIKLLIDDLKTALDTEISTRESNDAQNLTTAKSYTDTSITNQTTEIWTFTLLDGSTVSKKVVVK